MGDAKPLVLVTCATCGRKLESPWPEPEFEAIAIQVWEYVADVPFDGETLAACIALGLGWITDGEEREWYCPTHQTPAGEC